MTKPDDIPQDVWDKADQFCVEHGVTRCAVARGIMAERERCTEVERQMSEWVVLTDEPFAYALIAALREATPSAYINFEIGEDGDPVTDRLVIDGHFDMSAVIAAAIRGVKAASNTPAE